MKQVTILAVVVTFAIASFIHADAPATPKQPQPLVEEYRQRALDYLRTKRPELKVEQLQLESVSYDFHPKGPVHTDFAYTDSVYVGFSDPSSRHEEPRAGGHKIITTQNIGVTFSNTTSEPVIAPPSHTDQFAD